MIELQFATYDGFIYGAHVLGEAPTEGVRPLGGNVLEVPDAGWSALTDEQRGEIARFLVPTNGLTPPGEAGGGAAAPAVGRPPVGPMSQRAPLSRPPETGPGSARSAWVRYATENGVEYAGDAKRDDIIAAVDAQRPELVPVPEAPADAEDPDAPEAPPDASHPDAPPVMIDQEARSGQ